MCQIRSDNCKFKLPEFKSLSKSSTEKLAKMNVMLYSNSKTVRFQGKIVLQNISLWFQFGIVLLSTNL